MIYDLTNTISFHAWVTGIQTLTLMISKAWFPKWFLKEEIKRLAILARNGSQYLEHCSEKLPDKDLVKSLLDKAEFILLKRRLWTIST